MRARSSGWRRRRPRDAGHVRGVTPRPSAMWPAAKPPRGGVHREATPAAPTGARRRQAPQPRAGRSRAWQASPDAPGTPAAQHPRVGDSTTARGTAPAAPPHRARTDDEHRSQRISAPYPSRRELGQPASHGQEQLVAQQGQHLPTPSPAVASPHAPAARRHRARPQRQRLEQRPCPTDAAVHQDRAAPRRRRHPGQRRPSPDAVELPAAVGGHDHRAAPPSPRATRRRRAARPSAPRQRRQRRQPSRSFPVTTRRAAPRRAGGRRDRLPHVARLAIISPWGARSCCAGRRAPPHAGHRGEHQRAVAPAAAARQRAVSPRSFWA